MRSSLLVLILLAACSGSEPTGGEPIPAFVSIQAGDDYACGLAADGIAWCWGSSISGFGDGLGGTNPEYTPRPALSGVRFASLALGSQHACGIGLDGVAYCWGLNGEGAVGTGIPAGASEPSPAPVGGGLGLTQVAAGLVHSCGLTAIGAAWCWGSNDIGELGDGTNTNRLTPTPVAGGLTFAAISTRRGPGDLNDQNTCALTAGGAAWCWGGNGGGALGNGSASANAFAPVAVSGGLQFASLEATGGFVCGITTASDLYCWGRGDRTPALVPGGLEWSRISVSLGHLCGITTAGLIYCWGENRFGQLGIGPGTEPFVGEPTRIAGPAGLTWRDVSTGAGHTCAIATDDTTWCWGFGEAGELGIGELPAHTIPYVAFSPMQTTRTRAAE
jgi:alpha-tubulin suppressor-like RCC1 family protein